MTHMDSPAPPLHNSSSPSSPPTCALHDTIHNHLREQLKPLAHIPTMRVQLNFIIGGIVIVAGLVGVPLAEHMFKPGAKTIAPASIVYQLPPPQFSSLSQK